MAAETDPTLTNDLVALDEEPTTPPTTTPPGPGTGGGTVPNGGPYNTHGEPVPAK